MSADDTRGGAGDSRSPTRSSPASSPLASPACLARPSSAVPPTPRRTARSVAALRQAGLLNAEQARAAVPVGERYAIAVTPEMMAAASAIGSQTENGPGAGAENPIARQFLPHPEELEVAPEERFDPIGDDAFSPLPGVTHRYPDRVLLKPVHVCPVYCRFCFRREVVGPGGPALSAEELEAALDYVRRHPEVWEVILTGGDPLVLSPRRLESLVSDLAAIPHVASIRLHTRVPAVAPELVTPGLVRSLRADPATGAATWVVLHTNHARELTSSARAAIARLVDGGVPLLSQSVLLAGVNDDADTLAELFRALVALRVKPYYLHHPDLARGTGHFRVTLEAGRALMRRLRGRVSGLCQPTYVLDIPGGHGKVPVGPEYATKSTEGRKNAGGSKNAEGTKNAGGTKNSGGTRSTEGFTAVWEVRDPWGDRHTYPPPAVGGVEPSREP